MAYGEKRMKSTIRIFGVSKKETVIQIIVSKEENSAFEEKVINEELM